MKGDDWHTCLQEVLLASRFGDPVTREGAKRMIYRNRDAVRTAITERSLETDQALYAT